ncbi:hypothetical protein BCR41DRAFT_234311 [Lobosporangium transversale]|uniref:Uncharacterized protein n=1 Tax=Lobosporangium transversale TaxID=64571 RepID=A0A1Y2GUU5_9FUNG|nr:hypothetical protein BCR41DRAFT_234311 [Lobosporangium transversale]ORZ24824.1 hypothetical protein BCR41DRAFT_234311 [Lobosporangium transversale]|eukprot:XP_021883805.1 hypothetical protein BCR41DRAFT_234311 [Lobosporangium transversale]
MSYHGHNQHGQFTGSATTRPFAQHPQQASNSQIQGLAQQHTQQQQQQQQYAHLQHHNANNNSFGLSSLTSNSYKLDNTRDSRPSNGLQGYGNWNSPTDMTGFGQTHSSGQLSHMLTQPHHSASQPSLSISQYSQPQQQQQQPQQQPQQPQQQHQQQQAFLFSAHNQSPTHLRAQPQQTQQTQQQQPQQAQSQQQQPSYGSHHSSNHQGSQHFSSTVVSPASQLSRQQQPSAQTGMVGSGGLKPSTSLGNVSSVNRNYLDSALSTGPSAPSFGSTNNFGMAGMTNLRNTYGADDEGGNLIPNDDNSLDGVYQPLNSNPHGNQVQSAGRYQAQRTGSNPVTPNRLAHDIRPGQGNHILNNNPTTISQNQPLSSYDQRTTTPAMNSIKGDVMLSGGGVTGNSTQHQTSSRHLNQPLPQSPYSYHSTAQQSPQQPYPSPHNSILPQSQHQHAHQQSTPPGQSALTPKESPQLSAPKAAIVEPEPKKKQQKAPKAAAGAKKTAQGKKNPKIQPDNVPSPELGRTDTGSSHAMTSPYSSVDSTVPGHNRMYSSPLTPAALAQHQQQYPSFQQQQQQHQPSPQNTLQQQQQQQQPQHQAQVQHQQHHHQQQPQQQQHQAHQTPQQQHQQQQALRQHQRNESFETNPRPLTQPVAPPVSDSATDKPKGKGRGRKKKVVDKPADSAPAPAPAPAPTPTPALEPVVTPATRPTAVMPALPQTSSTPKLNKQQQQQFQQLQQQQLQQQQLQQQLQQHSSSNSNSNSCSANKCNNSSNSSNNSLITMLLH